jgi:hypothetical protein
MKTILSSFLALAFVLSASPSMAFDAKHLAQLEQTKKCPKCDLRGADLRGAKFCKTTQPNGKIANKDC